MRSTREFIDIQNQICDQIQDHILCRLADLSPADSSSSTPETRQLEIGELSRIAIVTKRIQSVRYQNHTMLAKIKEAPLGDLEDDDEDDDMSDLDWIPRVKRILCIEDDEQSGQDYQQPHKDQSIAEPLHCASELAPHTQSFSHAPEYAPASVTAAPSQAAVWTSQCRQYSEQATSRLSANHGSATATSNPVPS